MEKGIVTTGGNLVIPPKLRKKYGLKKGSKVFFSSEKDGIKVYIPITSHTIQENIGFLGTRGKLLKILMEEKRREREM